MQDIIRKIEAEQLREIASFRAGDTVRVHVRIKEGDKERTQAFEGVVIALRRGGARASFIVRKVSYGVGVERVFPLHAPSIDKVEVVTRGKIRQAKPFYLRGLRGKAARIKERDTLRPTRGGAVAEPVVPSAPAADDVAADAPA